VLFPLFERPNFPSAQNTNQNLCIFQTHEGREGRQVCFPFSPAMAVASILRQLLQHWCNAFNLNTCLQALQFRYLPTYFPEEHILTLVALYCTRNAVTEWLRVCVTVNISSLMCMLHFCLHNSTCLLRLAQNTRQPAKSAVPEYSMHCSGNSALAHETRHRTLKGAIEMHVNKNNFNRNGGFVQARK
jgi:hypothetical protein